MNRTDYSFKFSLFAKKVQMFSYGDMGIVVEKEPDVICAYGTDALHKHILCAVPLCEPKYIRGKDFTVSFFEDNTALVKVEGIMIFIDYNAHKVATCPELQTYGSDDWGRDVGMEWKSEFEK